MGLIFKVFFLTLVLGQTFYINVSLANMRVILGPCKIALSDWPFAMEGEFHPLNLKTWIENKKINPVMKIDSTDKDGKTKTRYFDLYGSPELVQEEENYVKFQSSNRKFGELPNTVAEEFTVIVEVFRIRDRENENQFLFEIHFKSFHNGTLNMEPPQARFPDQTSRFIKLIGKEP